MRFDTGFGFDAGPIAVIHKIYLHADFTSSSLYNNTPVEFAIVPPSAPRGSTPDPALSHALAVIPETLYARQQMLDSVWNGYAIYQFRLDTTVFVRDSFFIAMK